MSADTESARRLTRTLAWSGAILMLLVTTSSAYLRLRAAGLGCADWPACYGQGRDAAGALGSDWVAAARVLHRFAASAAGLLALLLLANLWRVRALFKEHTRAAVGLVLLTVGLAILGRMTPQARWAAIAVGNLLGGMGMSALFVFVALAARALRPALAASTRRAALLTVGVLALVMALGAMTSATYSGLACGSFPACAGAWWPADAVWQAFDPWRVPAPDTIGANMTLHMTHRYAALALVLSALWLSSTLLRLPGEPARWGAGVLTLLCLQVAAGVLMVLNTLPLPLALAHNMISSVLLCTVSAVLACCVPAAPVAAPPARASIQPAASLPHAP